MASTSQFRLQKVADLAARKNDDPTRHRCFVSYHVDDTDEVEDFLESFGHVFIGTVVGVTADDDFVDSDDTDYIMDRIREKYLSNTTVTIVMVGLGPSPLLLPRPRLANRRPSRRTPVGWPKSPLQQSSYQECA